MPCQTVTVQGPSIEGQITTVTFDVSTSENQALVTWEFRNDYNITTSFNVEISVDGSVIETSREWTLQPGGNTLETTTELNFDINEGSQRDMQICAEPANIVHG